jgi:hypothetical protein
MPALWNLLSFIMVLWSSPAQGHAPQPQPAATFPPHGGTFLTTLPAAASAWLDGAYVGETPVYVDDVLPGRHSVTISRSGWRPDSASFDVFVGRITPVSVIMHRVEPQGAIAAAVKGHGMLAVYGGPPGAKVFVDGVSIGVSPVEPKSAEAGYHIVMLQPPGKNAEKSTRIVDVFPDSTTAVDFASTSMTGAQTNPVDDILEPLDSVVPSGSVVVAGNIVTIHYHGVEVECAIGSRSYTLNGKAGTLSVPPALVGAKVYLPVSLLNRLKGK